MKTLQWFRFAVFGVWLVTILAIIGVFVWTLVRHDMVFNEIQSSLEKVAALVTPQVGIMLAFFFGASKARQERLAESEEGVVNLALILSFVYHVVFWLILLTGVVYGRLGRTIGENTDAVIKIMSLIGLIGLSPIAYLFARGETAPPADETLPNQPTAR
jgi:hypothetical protein